jgi:hypothetical protein
MPCIIRGKDSKQYVLQQSDVTPILDLQGREIWILVTLKQTAHAKNNGTSQRIRAIQLSIYQTAARR